MSIKARKRVNRVMRERLKQQRHPVGVDLPMPSQEAIDAAWNHVHANILNPTPDEEAELEMLALALAAMTGTKKGRVQS